jgi:hypothetical protein
MAKVLFLSPYLVKKSEMKTTRDSFKKASLLLLIIVSSMSEAYGQDSKKERDSLKAVSVTNMMAAKDYVFKAESVSPVKGGIKHLSGDYTLIVSNDTVVADLPYYGRAYQAGYGSSDGGIKFTSTNFEYAVTHSKKDEWDVNLKPKDYKNVQLMILTIFDNSRATLRVNSHNRQPISFDGYIEERKPHK